MADHENKLFVKNVHDGYVPIVQLNGGNKTPCIPMCRCSYSCPPKPIHTRVSKKESIHIPIRNKSHCLFNVTICGENTNGNHIRMDDAVSLKELLDVGIDNMIAGVITTDATDIQQRYASMYNVGDQFSILPWNRTLIKVLLNLSNSLWQYRSGILHDTKELSRETMIKLKAVESLYELRKYPYCLPYTSRDLALRSKSEIINATLTNVRNWISRVNVALDVQTQRMNIVVSDIREWLSKKYEFEDELQDNFYMLGVENESYNSDDTRAYVDKSPDEDTDTWDSIKCAISCLKKGGRMCGKRCLCLSDRFSICTPLPASVNNFISLKPPQ